MHDGYVKEFFRKRRYEAFRGYLKKKQLEGNVGQGSAVEL